MLANEIISKICLEKDMPIEHISIIKSAILYAERFQHKSIGYYQSHQIPPKTEQAIVLIVEHIISNSNECVWNKINSLLRFNMY